MYRLLIRVVLAVLCLVGAIVAIETAGWWAVAGLALLAVLVYIGRQRRERRMQLRILSSYIGEQLAASSAVSYQYLASLDQGFVELLHPEDASTFRLRPEARQIKDRLRHVWMKERSDTAIFEGEQEVTLYEFMSAFEAWCKVYGSISVGDEPASQPVEA